MDPFVAEVRIFPFNFAPKGWAWCDGQLLPISQNTALFSLLGTSFGGDGKSTFALPDFQGDAVVHAGQGAGLSQYDVGQMGGSETVTLLESEIPAHSHGWKVSAATAIQNDPTGQYYGGGDGINEYAAPGALAQMAFQSLTPAGGSLPHNNMMPYLTLFFCIALQGVFPPRT